MAFSQINGYVQWCLWRHLRRRSQRPFRPPHGMTVFAQMKRLGLTSLLPCVGSACACLRRRSLREPDAGNVHVRFDEGRGPRAFCIASSPTLPPPARIEFGGVYYNNVLPLSVEDWRNLTRRRGLERFGGIAEKRKADLFQEVTNKPDDNTTDNRTDCRRDRVCRKRVLMFSPKRRGVEFGFQSQIIADIESHT